MPRFFKSCNISAVHSSSDIDFLFMIGGKFNCLHFDLLDSGISMETLHKPKN